MKTQSPINHYRVLAERARSIGNDDQASVWSWAEYHCVRMAESESMETQTTI